MMNSIIIEREIIECSKAKDKPRLYAINTMLQNEKAKLDYFMSKFIEKYGKKLDEKIDDNYNRFFSDKTRDYAVITRLMRIVNAYSK